MATSTKERSRQSITKVELDNSWFGFRTAYHLLGWVAVVVLLVFLDPQRERYTVGFEAIKVGVELIFCAGVIYFNLFYLIPRYLSRNRYLLYLLLLILACMAVTPLELLPELIVYGMPGDWTGVRHYFFLTFTIAGLSTMGRIMTDWFRDNQERQELQTQTMQSELRFLKSQINPHFLFNTLNSLYALTLKKSDRAPDIVIKLSEMMRYMLYECNEKRVPLRKEINYLHNYLDLERLRQRNNMDIEMTVDGEVGEQQIAPLMFIPFVENSFKHGLSSGLADGFVHIHIHVHPRSVEFSIENSKSSLLPSPGNPNRPSGGIGLVNVRRRLELLYPEANELQISESPNTYGVKLQLQLD
ncbi:MAG: histidine kinase [Bacteroidota bacterium]